VACSKSGQDPVLGAARHKDPASAITVVTDENRVLVKRAHPYALLGCAATAAAHGANPGAPGTAFK
jgi:hypothetical protein